MQVAVAKNTVTNYLVILIRVFQGLLVTRWLIEYLGESGYGFWMLLWSFFVYAILVDFGFGISAQKFTSLELFKRDIQHYNSIISMIFTFQSIMAVALVLCVVIASFFLPEILNVTDPDQLAYYRKCFLVFSLGSAVIFPLCLFTEIMVGLHKIYVKNYIDAATRFLELIGFLAILKLGGGLFGIIVFAIVLMGAERSFTGFYALRCIPGFRLRFHLFDRQVFREVFGFSSGTYFMSMAALLRVQMRNPIMSKYCGLDSVGIFNISNRLPDLCNQAIGQYNINVRPVTAQLFHRGRFRMLRDFIVKSMQWNMFMCCLIVVPAIFLRDEAINALFKVEVTPLIHDLCLLNLIGTSIWLAMTQIPSSVLLMCEKHHLQAWVSMIEACAVVLLNILFLRGGFGVEYVAIVAIVTSFAAFAAVRFPVMLKLIRGKALRELWNIYVPSLLTAVPAVAALLFCKKLLLGHVHNFLLCAVCGTVYAVVYVIISWQFLVGRAKKELWKRRVMIRVRRYLKKG
jgi:O-antigen/teichoic acid export membrane protein